ncbi:oxidoreductase [Kordiimonas sediminis]|uniref:Oxidoreductase n=1 Tax=Kordiimonas sediminis TaxID=1735581 RepID=A0A919AW83_9PROT|nr:FAD-binding oxidoreductase [Kordiimonas sediminis]GHF26176.1 oxidoreductase [Kordiimonas sediminis]
MRITDRVHSNTMPQSYYAATSNDTDGFDRLTEDCRTDVCVVGGGFTGVATALHLRERGYDVVLLEQNEIGWGASGRNGGQVIGGYGPSLSEFSKIEKVFGKENAVSVWQMGVECVDIIADWVEKYQIDCDLTWGYFDAAMKQSDMDYLLRARDTLLDHGYKPEQRIIKQDEVHTIVGSDRYIGGVTNMGWGHAHVLNLLRGEARAAQKLGAKIFEHAMVEDVTFGEPVTVKTDKGTVTADYVVFAGNAYLGKLVPKLESRVLPAGSYIVTTEPLSEEMVQEIMPANFAICDQRWALDYFRLTADRRLLFGGLATYSGLHPKDIKKAILPCMHKVFPQLQDVKIDHEWGGYMGIGINRIPQVGQVAPNAYFAQAYSGHGVAPTHMSGKLIAEAIDGNKQRFDIMARIKHPPFPGGRLLRAPMQAIGMAYYRLKDAIG